MNLLTVTLLLIVSAVAQAATTTYAATNVGPYVSTDGGATWRSLPVSVTNPSLQGVPNVAVIAVDPVTPSNVYFLGSVSGTTAFFSSTDSGKTWSAVLMLGVQGVANIGDQVFWLCIDPVATNNLILDAAGTVLTSADSGATWTELPGVSALGGIKALATDPVKSGVLYSTNGSGKISKSTDFGNTWTTLAKLLYYFPPSLGGIYVDPANHQRLWVSRTSSEPCYDNNGSPIDCGLFNSQDGGQTWARITLPGPTGSVAFDRVTGDIYAGGIWTGIGTDVAKSSDQGKTWIPTATVHAGVNDGPYVSADPAAAGHVYVFGYLGTFEKTTNGGATWTNVGLPPYCTGTSSTCPSNLRGTPQVFSLAYAFAAPAPPPPLTTTTAGGLQSGVVSTESIATSNGAHLATGTATADADQPPLTLAGTTVTVVDSNGTSQPAPLLAVSPTQVTYEIPAGLADGAATVTIVAADGVTSTGPLQIADVSPGLDTLNAAGLVKAYVVRLSNGNLFVEDVYEIDPTGAVIPRPVTISNGDQVQLIVYGTGFRAAGTGGVNVTIGGESAQVYYAGPQGVAPGVDQFTILIPPDLLAGVVQIVMTAEGQAANTVIVAVQ